jgi:hypothetical protein
MPGSRTLVHAQPNSSSYPSVVASTLAVRTLMARTLQLWLVPLRFVPFVILRTLVIRTHAAPSPCGPHKVYLML